MEVAMKGTLDQSEYITATPIVHLVVHSDSSGRLSKPWSPYGESRSPPGPHVLHMTNKRWAAKIKESQGLPLYLL